MARKFSQRIVIDTDIAFSASETDFPQSIASRKFLQAVIRICHRVVMSPDIMREWRKHKSRFATKWLAAMEQKGKVVECDPQELTDLREKIANEKFEFANGEALTDNHADMMLKDVHLIEAAFVNDRLVASFDETVRRLFRIVASTFPTELRIIVWVNPQRQEDAAIDWLDQGASDEAERRLGFSET